MGLDSLDASLPRKVVKTNDGVGLSVIDIGVGRPFVILPAWTSSARQYYATIFDLGRGRRVVAVFRSDYVSSIILVDQAATQLIQPQWSAKQRMAFGCTHTAEELFEHCRKLAGSEGEAFTRDLFASIFTRGFPREEFEWILAETLAMPRKYVSALMLDHAQRDWRDVISRIEVPALVVGARTSIFPMESQEWIACQIPRAQLAIFEEHEGGSHFMCFENPSHFIAVVCSFLSAL